MGPDARLCDRLRGMQVALGTAGHRLPTDWDAQNLGVWMRGAREKGMGPLGVAPQPMGGHAW